MAQIIPTVLATSEEQYQKDILRFAAVEALQGGWVHLDFMDNKFVPNKGIDPLLTSKYPVPFNKEAHLMVQHPIEWLEKLVKSEFKKVYIQVESEGEPRECIDYIRKQGLEVGLVLNNDTVLERLEPYIAQIDAVLLMSVVPGFQGQPFIEGVTDKIKETFHLRSKGSYGFKIGVDGAVKDTNIKQIVDAGADFVIVGSYLLKGDINENLERLWEAIRNSS